MRLELAKKLQCPKCKKPLECYPFEPGRQEEVEIGILICRECQTWYPIDAHVPVLLRFPTIFHESFEKKNRGNLVQFSDVHPPNGRPHPGERSIQETFTDEWQIADLGEEKLSFTYTSDDLTRLNKDVWLRWSNTCAQEIKSVLNVGCGLGREAQVLAGMFVNAEILALDLNFSLLRSGKRLSEGTRIQPIICSLFDIPLSESSIDLVYSQGVLHHTFSTYEAFQSISRYVKDDGYLFIWVYGLDDHLVLKGGIGLLGRIVYWIELIFRPSISRLPRRLRDLFFLFLAPIVHPLMLLRVRHKTKWTLKNTEHGLRDWLSPRFAFTHSYNEVFEWFEECGFKIIDHQSTRNYRRLFGKRLWGVGCTGRKMKIE